MSIPRARGRRSGRAQIAQTEQRIVAAATELFLADGYVATTLEAVAKRAQVGVRTVYLRFGTKAALFKRVVDVAIVGDTELVDVLGRDWMQAALTAPTAAERIAACAAAGRQIMERTAPCSASPSRPPRSSRSSPDSGSKAGSKPATPTPWSGPGWPRTGCSTPRSTWSG